MLIADNQRVRELLDKYEIPYSLLGGAETYFKLDGKRIFEIYLTMLDRHQIYSSKVDFNRARVFCEIGGGFGANVHLILSNYANIRKVIYIDIAPNLYVATQYLKSFYGESVLDYRMMKSAKKFSFADDNNLEILCIAPWQMELVSAEIDIFQNDSSFVEMPISVIQKYQEVLQTWDSKNSCSMLIGSYLTYNSETTLDPTTLSSFFPLKVFEQLMQPELCSPLAKYMYQISTGC